LTWSSRFGYEEPPGPQTTVSVLRTSISLVQAFSARLRATGGLSIASSVSSDDATGKSTSTNSFSIDAGMQYSLSRNMTLTGSYNFTGTLSSVAASDYLRNTIYFGVQYAY